uniref:Uncharacterized protein n=1 Tax=Tanacetum cinerariifolium TaxID=118510 RepID=A0A6L2JK44_TANCI|nr:hypothetical protein [Tanacetum cinerariifolium]
MYVEYLKDFWYTTKVDDTTKDILLSLSLFENQLTFTRFDFLSAIGLTDSKNVVPLAPKGTVRAGLATLGLTVKDKPSLTSTELTNSSPLKTPSATEVNLTSHMLKVAKLSKKPKESLILPSEEVNAEESANKSQEINPSSTTTHLQATEELMVTVVPLQSLEASVTVEVQENQLKAADTTETMNNYEESASIQENSDSDLQSMPNDDLRSVSGFESADSKDTHDNEVSHSVYTSKDNSAFAKRLSLPDHIDHICEEVISLHSRLGDMETFIVQKVSNEIRDTNSAEQKGGKANEQIKEQNEIPAPTQEEHQTTENITPPEPTPKTQGELAYKESTLLVSKTKVNEESAMVLYDFKKDLAKRLGLPLSPELATFELTAEEKKRKRTKFIKESFVTKNIRVDRMDRNSIPPLRIMPIQGLVINKPES